MLAVILVSDFCWVFFFLKKKKSQNKLLTFLSVSADSFQMNAEWMLYKFHALQSHTSQTWYFLLGAWPLSYDCVTRMLKGMMTPDVLRLHHLLLLMLNSKFQKHHSELASDERFGTSGFWIGRQDLSGVWVSALAPRVTCKTVIFRGIMLEFTHGLLFPSLAETRTARQHKSLKKQKSLNWQTAKF